MHKTICLFQANMSAIMQAMVLIKATFDKYAGKEGDIDTLTKNEVAELLRSEIPGTSVSRKMKYNEHLFAVFFVFPSYNFNIFF